MLSSDWSRMASPSADEGIATGSEIDSSMPAVAWSEVVSSVAVVDGSPGFGASLLFRSNVFRRRGEQGPNRRQAPPAHAPVTGTAIRPIVSGGQ
ncbi:hypothetical protein RJ55_00765 [Drechmeria coniospora]|nr:hypothetical protein RJ55_00765 [Drechmeria coniospora]